MLIAWKNASYTAAVCFIYRCSLLHIGPKNASYTVETGAVFILI